MVLVRLRQDLARRALGGAGRVARHTQPGTAAPVLDRAAERSHEGYRRLERKLDPQTSSLLVATVTSLQSGALFAALQAEIALFRELRAVVFDRYGLAFDPKQGEILEEEINRDWAEDRP